MDMSDLSQTLLRPYLYRPRRFNTHILWTESTNYEGPQSYPKSASGEAVKAVPKVGQISNIDFDGFALCNHGGQRPFVAAWQAQAGE